MPLSCSRASLVLVCLALVAGGCSQEPAPPPPPRPAGRPMAVPREPAIAQAYGLAQFKTEYAQAYRLKPDARFLLALSNLEHLLTGQPRAEVEVRFQDGTWRLLSHGEELGSLPAFPDFTHALELLDARAQKLGLEKLQLAAGKEPLVRGPLPVGRETLEVLRQLDRNWSASKRSATALHQGARALAMLSFQLVDLTETADAVSAQALVHLALARAATGEKLTEEQALLAHSLGYSRAALQLAQGLPVDSLVRAFFLKDDAALRASPQARRQPGLIRYLELRRLADMGRTQRTERQREKKSTPGAELAEVSARLLIHEFESERLWGSVTPEVLLREVATAAGSPGEDAAPRQRVKQTLDRFGIRTRGMLPPFEEQLSRVGQPGAFFLDAEVERAWFQGLFFSAQSKLGLHLLDARASPTLAQELASSLGEASSPVGKDFQAWLAMLIAAKAGQQTEAELMKGLTEFQSLGAAPLMRLFEELEDRADWGDPALSSMTRRLVTRLDSRPEHRAELGSMARTALSDIALSETLYRAAAEAAVLPSTEAWLAWLDRDLPKLQAMERDPSVPAKVRLKALENLMEAKAVAPEALMGQLAPLLEAQGKEWAFTSRSVELLEQLQRDEEAQALVEQWLKAQEKTGAFDVILARTTLARLYQKQGNPQAAWKAVEPVIASGQYGALDRAALVSQELGEAERALELARKAAQRYPGPKSLGLLAEILWRSGESEKVAELLAKPARPLRSMDWRVHVGRRFAAVFAKRPVAEGLSAFEVLRKARLGALELSQLAVAVGHADNPELAFKLQSRIAAPGLQKLELLMGAYGYLQKWKSEQAAVEWLRKQVPEPLLAPLSMFAFVNKADTVLWELVPSPQETVEQADYVWLMRAAASLRAPELPEDRKAALRQRFEVERPGFYHQVGRYLLGLIPEDAVIEAAVKPKSRQELPYFLGFKAQAEGRYADAVTWYRATVETSEPKMGEYRWAYDELTRFRSAGLSLARMKER